MKREIRYRHHSRAVSQWIDEELPNADQSTALKKFETVFNGLLTNIEVSIGTTTLAAVLDRVTYNSGNRFPMLNAIKNHGNQIDVSGLFASPLEVADINEAFHFLTTELLSTIGNLTAETVTPLLHSFLKTKKART